MNPYTLIDPDTGEETDVLVEAHAEGVNFRRKSDGLEIAYIEVVGNNINWWVHRSLIGQNDYPDEYDLITLVELP